MSGFGFYRAALVEHVEGGRGSHHGSCPLFVEEFGMPYHSSFCEGKCEVCDAKLSRVWLAALLTPQGKLEWEHNRECGGKCEGEMCVMMTRARAAPLRIKVPPHLSLFLSLRAYAVRHPMEVDGFLKWAEQRFPLECSGGKEPELPKYLDLFPREPCPALGVAELKYLRGKSKKYGSVLEWIRKEKLGMEVAKQFIGFIALEERERVEGRQLKEVKTIWDHEKLCISPYCRLCMVMPAELR